METIEEYLASKESQEYCSTCSSSMGGTSSDVGDWFNDFWAKLQAGDFGALALTGLVVFLVIDLVRRR